VTQDAEEQEEEGFYNFSILRYSARGICILVGKQVV